jgi:hypothetical protein
MKGYGGAQFGWGSTIACESIRWKKLITDNPSRSARVPLPVYKTDELAELVEKQHKRASVA